MSGSDRMSAAMRQLEAAFPGCAIVLVVAPFGAAPGNCANYIGNGKRDDIRVLLKEVVARWEGRMQDAPAGKQ